MTCNNNKILMKLQKYTKAELISKLNKTNRKEGTPNLTIKNYFLQIWNLILTFKSILLKITLVGLLLKFIQKYRIIRVMWSILTGIVMTIFGISTIDSFGFSSFIDEIKTITYNIVNYFSNTSFYNYLRELYGFNTPGTNPNNNNESLKNVSDVDNPNLKGGKEVIKTKTIEKIENQKSESLRDKYNKSSIAEWLKPKADEVYKSDPNILHPQRDAYEAIKNSESWYNWKYILIGAGIITISCLSYVYFDEIREVGTAFMDWIFSWRSRGGGAPTSGATNSETNNHNNSSTSNTMNTGTIDPTNLPLPNSPNTPDIELIDETRKRLFHSPSLDELNEKAKDSFNTESWSPSNSTSSSSSNETIKPSSKIKLDSIPPITPLTDSPTSNIEIVKVESPFPLENSTLDLKTKSNEKIGKFITNFDVNDKFLLNLDLNWKKFINSDILKKIEYIETHAIKSDIQEITIAEQLFNEILSSQIKFYEEITQNMDKLNTEELKIKMEIHEYINKWVDNTKRRLDD